MMLIRSTARQAARHSRGQARAATGGADEAREAVPRVFIIDRGKRVEQKVCVVCERGFTWRKKWERSWDAITTCSKRCNSERRRLARVARKSRGERDGAELAAIPGSAVHPAKVKQRESGSDRIIVDNHHTIRVLGGRSSAGFRDEMAQHPTAIRD